MHTRLRHLALSAPIFFLATSASAASIGDQCSGGADCSPLNGGCVSSSGAYLDGTEGDTGVCRGGDSDPCTGAFTGGDCAPGFACAPCDVALYGSWECRCAHPGNDGCEADTDCPAGKACDGFGDCRTPCTSDADCATGEACPQEGLCIAVVSCAPSVCLPLSDACHDAACAPAECAALPVCGG